MALTALSPDQIAQHLASLPGWAHDSGVISKTYALPTYTAGLAFASAAGIVCEGLNHHPELTIGYKTVRVSFTTHDAGNIITENDIAAARAIEALGYPRR